MEWLWIALGGACGACARYGAGVLLARFWQTPLPLATWAVNVLGCLLIGVLVPVLGRAGVPGALRYGLIVGFLGSLTTFSAFSLETVVLLQKGLGGAALLNALGSVVLGLLCVWLGLRLGGWLVDEAAHAAGR